MQKITPKISPFLWFNDKAEEAANFYVAVFGNSKIVDVKRYGEGGPGPKGSVMLVSFEIEGQRFNALNGGPTYSFTPAVSFVVNCEDQREVDHYWDKLTSDGGKPVQCGWLTDKYGLSWQIVPTALLELMSSNDPQKNARVMGAMMQMVKLDIAKLRAAAENN
jgi:predicted 3-demethylubiquinone-9 3-methyltransferase (glyoxalase superfamily)